MTSEQRERNAKDEHWLDEHNKRQLEHDKLDALMVFMKARPNGDGSPIVRLLFRDANVVIDEILGAYHTRKSGTIALDVGIFDLPKVERIEILVSAYIDYLYNIANFTGMSQHTLCNLVGCCETPTGTIRERWRRIIFETDPRFEYKAESLIAKMYEDRPLCGWCKGPLITGSAHSVRKDLHDGCYEYLMRVVRPQLQAARAAEKKAYEGGSNG